MKRPLTHGYQPPGKLRHGAFGLSPPVNSYRTCQVSLTLALCAWAGVVLGAIVFPGGHPPLFLILLYYATPATLIVAAIGLVSGFIALADKKRREVTVPLLAMHGLLALIAIMIWRRFS